MTTIKSSKDFESDRKTITISRSAVAMPRRLATSRLNDAVMMLMNNQLPAGPYAPKGVLNFPPELVTLARGLFQADKVYNFEMHASGTDASIGGGVLQFSHSWSPATTSFAEWSALSALFDEVCLRSTEIVVTSAFGPTSTAIVVQMAVAPDSTATSGATPSFTTVQRLAESEFYHCAWMQGGSGSFKKKHSLPKDSRPYAQTSAPHGPSSSPPCGCLGSWAFASSIVGTASINYQFWTMKEVVALRSRA